MMINDIYQDVLKSLKGYAYIFITLSLFFILLAETAKKKKILHLDNIVTIFFSSFLLCHFVLKLTVGFTTGNTALSCVGIMFISNKKLYKTEKF